MRIFQITDLHIGGAGEKPFDVDVRANFLRILETLKSHNFDLLVISGDLCYQDGEAAIYRWIRQELEQSGLPYCIIPGNHDDDQLLIEHFGLPASYCDSFFFHLPTPAPPTVFLNSGKGHVAPAQTKQLEAYLKGIAGPVCLFMHHPPLPMGVPYMDQNHAMRECDDLLDVLTKHPYPISIFTGHYHVDKSLRWKNLDIHITPSCFFQINWRKEQFEVDHHNCAFRWIDWDGEYLRHGLLYLETPVNATII